MTEKEKRAKNPPVHEAFMEVLAEDMSVGLIIADVLYGQKEAKVPPEAIPDLVKALKKAEGLTGMIATSAIVALETQLAESKDSPSHGGDSTI